MRDEPFEQFEEGLVESRPLVRRQPELGIISESKSSAAFIGVSVETQIVRFVSVVKRSVKSFN